MLFSGLSELCEQPSMLGYTATVGLQATVERDGAVHQNIGGSA